MSVLIRIDPTGRIVEVLPPGDRSTIPGDAVSVSELPADFSVSGYRWIGYLVPAASAPAGQSVRLSLTLTASTERAGIGQPITIAAQFDVPITDTFAVPVLNLAGIPALVKAVSVVDGYAEISVSFPASGYYCVTESAINSQLPPGVFIALPQPLNLTIYE